MVAYISGDNYVVCYLMRPILTILFILNALLSFGQTFVYPTIKRTGKFIKDFVPSGWTILDSATGDLNNDNQYDATVILQHIDSTLIVEKEDNFEDSVVTQPRILIILFKNSTNNLFNLFEQSNSFILTHDSPFIDDPYQSISIKRGILQIDFYWYPTSGNWFNTTAYKFRYQKNNFFLIGADYEESNKASHDFNRHSYNFLARKMTSTNGNWDKKTAKSKTEVLDFGNLKTIETIKRPYDWESGGGIDL
jgi:hypothetical protein